MLFCLAILGIYHFFDQYAERKTTAKIDEVSRVMNYNQEAFRELATAQVPIKIGRAEFNGVVNPQNFRW